MNLKAPNGNASNLNPNQYYLVRTDAFKAWFGDWEKLAMAKLKDAAMDEVTLSNLSKDVSKVLDENGEPLVVYHTVKEKYDGFTKFRIVNDGNEIGSHFGTKEQALHVAKNALVENPKIFECFLNIKNPIIVDDMGYWTASNYEFIFRKKNIQYNKSGDLHGTAFVTVDDVFQALKDNDIDGMIYRNIYEGSGLSYMVYYPNQIKLADGTNTTFDSSNPYITFNNGGLIASNGKKSNLNAQQYKLVRTKAFKDWFGDWENDPENASKVVDENGEPLVVYHGSNNDFNIFEENKIGLTDKGWYGYGYYFSPSTEMSDLYGKSKPYFLKIKKIFNTNKENPFYLGGKEVTDNYINKGYEGSSKTFDVSKLFHEYCVFYQFPNNIKLADGTNTTFDIDNHDIRFNYGGKMKSVSEGTITVGASHEEGGIQVYNKGTGQMLEVEGGEGIINKRSMALNKQVTFNGDKMTPCEAASEINQMAGGVAYDCDNANSSKETYNNGGEFNKGRKMEAEHKSTLDKLYKRDINPKEAIDEIVKEHLSENPKYYSTEGTWTPPRRKKTKYPREKKYFDMGGMSEDFDFGLGSLDSFVNSKISPVDRDTPDQEIIDWTITKGRELLDTDILQQILKNVDAKWKPYFMPYQTFNLYKLGWRLQFGSSRQWAGLCSWDGQTSKNIYISIQFVKHDKNWQKNAIDTIQHEIAHACVTEGIILKVGQAAFNKIDPMYAANTGHGDSWKSICQAINVEGNCSVFYTDSNMKPSFRPFKYECVNCMDKGYGNRSGFTSNCFKCFKPVVVTKNI